MNYHYAIKTIYDKSHVPIAVRVLLIDRMFTSINTILTFDSVQEQLDEIISGVNDVICGNRQEYSITPNEDVPYMEIKITSEFAYSIDQPEIILETGDFLELLMILKTQRNQIL